MAHSRSAIKRARQSEKRRIHNKAVKSALKTQIKKVRTALEKKDVPLATKELKALQQMLDKAAVRNVIHNNKASRLKSRLTLVLNRLSKTTA